MRRERKREREKERRKERAEHESFSCLLSFSPLSSLSLSLYARSAFSHSLYSQRKLSVSLSDLARRARARIMHRFLSRSDESADLTRRVTRKRVPQAPANVLLSTLRRPTECNAVGAHSTTDDCGAAVENLCIVRAK